MHFGTDMTELLKMLLEDPKATEKLTGDNLIEIWAPLMKSMKLTFLDATDAAILREYFEEAVCNLMLMKRRGAFTKVDGMNVMMLRMLFYANLNRSVGTTENKMNERIAQLTSITHQTGTWKEETGRGRSLNPLRLVGKR